MDRLCGKPEGPALAMPRRPFFYFGKPILRIGRLIRRMGRPRLALGRPVIYGLKTRRPRSLGQQAKKFRAIGQASQIGVRLGPGEK